MTAAPIIGITKTYVSIKMLNIENRKSLKMFFGGTGISKLQILNMNYREAAHSKITINRKFLKV